MDQLPTPLHALADDRMLVARCLTAIDEERPAVERADLARATALLAARYENVLADTLYPQIAAALGPGSELERAEGCLQQAREAIGTVRADLRGVAPIDAHVSDPEGLDRDIDAMVHSLRELFRLEDAGLFPLIERLSPSEVDGLRHSIESACAHQTTLPDPPDNGLVRKLAEVTETVRLALNDQSTPWHPGVDALLDRSE